MRKKIIITILLCVMLTGCGKQNVKPAGDVPGTEETGETPANSSDEVSENDNLNKINSPFGLENDTAPASIGLCETDEYILNLIRYKDIYDGDTNYCLELVGDIDEENGNYPIISIGDIVINDQSLPEGETKFYFSSEKVSGNRWFSDFKLLENYIILHPDFSFEKMSGTVTIFSPAADDYSRTEETHEFCVDIPEETYSEYLFLPYMDALAQTQIIRLDDEMIIRLLGGGNPDIDALGENMVLLLECTNLTDETKPFYVNSAVVNGTNCGESMGAQVLPGKTRIFLYEIPNSYFEEQSIESIYDLQLVLLTDINENKAVNNETYRGGKAYPVELAEKGDFYEPEIGGTLIYERDGIELYFDGFDTDSLGTATCELVVVNNGDEVVACDFEDTTEDEYYVSSGLLISLDGKLTEYYVGSVPKDLAPNTYRHISLKVYGDSEPSSVPCTFYVMTAGGGGITDTANVVFE